MSKNIANAASVVSSIDLEDVGSSQSVQIVTRKELCSFLTQESPDWCNYMSIIAGLEQVLEQDKRTVLFVAPDDRRVAYEMGHFSHKLAASIFHPDGMRMLPAPSLHTAITRPASIVDNKIKIFDATSNTLPPNKKMIGVRDHNNTENQIFPPQELYDIMANEATYRNPKHMLCVKNGSRGSTIFQTPHAQIQPLYGDVVQIEECGEEHRFGLEEIRAIEHALARAGHSISIRALPDQQFAVIVHDPLLGEKYEGGRDLNEGAVPFPLQSRKQLSPQAQIKSHLATAIGGAGLVETWTKNIVLEKNYMALPALRHYRESHPLELREVLQDIVGEQRVDQVWHGLCAEHEVLEYLYDADLLSRIQFPTELEDTDAQRQAEYLLYQIKKGNHTDLHLSERIRDLVELIQQRDHELMYDDFIAIYSLLKRGGPIDRQQLSMLIQRSL